MKQHELRKIANDCALKIKESVLDVEFFKEPYSHCVIDNFFPPAFAEKLFSGFPPLESEDWERTNDPEIEVKLRSAWKSEFDIPDDILPAIRILNSSMILNAMASRFEISKLIPDPYFTGGGLNVMVSGGLLDVHVDGNYHDASGLNRRINALVYLNPKWEKGWGGEFGIYDSKGETLIKKVEPLFNRLVIFDTNDFSFHGLPDSLNFPKLHARRSIILYYYTKEARPSFQILVDEPHSALWKRKNLLDKRGNKTRSFE
jgi:Rps23 Pro-64 3,4-dihydroxylase Tpa1-like proline 4-hydroxylase